MLSRKDVAKPEIIEDDPLPGFHTVLARYQVDHCFIKSGQDPDAWMSVVALTDDTTPGQEPEHHLN